MRGGLKLTDFDMNNQLQFFIANLQPDHTKSAKYPVLISVI